MKRKLKLISAVLALGLAVLILAMAGYVAGWKTGSPPRLGLAGEGIRAATQPKTEELRIEKTAHKANLQPIAPADASLEETLATAWNALRFASEPEIAAARLWELLGSLDESELASAFRQACDLPGGATQKQAIWMVLRHWAEKNPEQAIEACAREFKGWDRLHWMVDLLGLVAPRDPVLGYRAYRDHLADLDAPSHDSAVFPLGSIFRSWVEKDLLTAWTELEKLNPREQQYAWRGMSALILEPSLTSEGLMQRLNESGNASLIEMARLEIARKLGRGSDIQRAEFWLEAQELPPETSREIEDAIAQSWALENPRAAADWLRQRASSGESGRRLERVIDLWADWEPVECAEWLNTQLQSGANLDSAISVFARDIVSKEPATALDWAAQIRDAAKRRRTTELLGESFQRRLVANGEELIRNSPLPEADKNAALQKLTRR